MDNIVKYYTSVKKLNGLFDTNTIWKIKEENGKKGEQIIWNYLSTKHSNLTFRKPMDFEGYDIEGFLESKIKRKRLREVIFGQRLRLYRKMGNRFLSHSMN